MLTKSAVRRGAGNTGDSLMKLSFSGFRLAVAAAAVFASTSASAATIVVNHVLNPADIQFNSYMGDNLAMPFTMEAGDTLDLTLTFTGGVSASFFNEYGLWLLSLTSGGPSGTLDVSGTVEFLGASANIVSGPIAVTDLNSFVHIGTYLPSFLYRTDAAPISFTGLHQIITIDSDDIGEPRTYESVGLTYFGNVVSGAVPEPASWAMFIAGFGLVGAAMRRRPATLRV